MKPLTVSEALTLTTLCPSRSESLRIIKQGGAYINNRKAEDDRVLNRADVLHDKYIVIRKGKKDVKGIILEEAVGAPSYNWDGDDLMFEEPVPFPAPCVCAEDGCEEVAVVGVLHISELKDWLCAEHRKEEDDEETA